MAFSEYENITFNLHSSSNIYLFQNSWCIRDIELVTSSYEKSIKSFKNILYCSINFHPLHVIFLFSFKNKKTKQKTKQKQNKKIRIFFKAVNQMFSWKRNVKFWNQFIAINPWVPNMYVVVYTYTYVLIWKKLCADKYWSFLWITKYVCIIVRWVMEFLTCGDKIS